MNQAWNWLFLFFSLLPHHAFCSEEEAKNQGSKNQFWTVGLAGERYSYKSGEGYELLGNSGVITAGYGYIKDRWFSIANADFITGPFNPSRNKVQELDYSGTGLNLWWGYSAQELDLRHPAGGYGFTLGINYSDIVGRNAFEQDSNSPPGLYGERGTSFNYSVRMTAATLSPGLFFCWLKPARGSNFSRENVRTRIEGYILSIAFRMPIFSAYRASEYLWKVKDEAGILDGPNPNSGNSMPIRTDLWETEKVYTHGKLKGFTLLVSFQSLLGV